MDTILCYNTLHARAVPDICQLHCRKRWQCSGLDQHQPLLAAKTYYNFNTPKWNEPPGKVSDCIFTQAKQLGINPGITHLALCTFQYL